MKAGSGPVAAHAEPAAFLRACVAESLATGMMVLFGTGAMVIDDTLGGKVGHGGIAAAFGLVVMVLIYAFGAISGAHANPAVTLGFWAAGRFPARRIPGYVLAQIIGAFAASAFIALTLPSHPTLGATLPHTGVANAFAWEVLLTTVLMLVILQVATGAKELGLIAAIAIGGTVGLEALVAGPICDASMNPARSLAPAVVSGRTEHLWLYLLAPTLGALLAVGLWRALRLPQPTPTTPEPIHA